MSLTPIFDQLHHERAMHEDVATPTTVPPPAARLLGPTRSGESRAHPGPPATIVDLAAETVHILALAQREAHALGHRHYGTEHLVLALVCSGHPVGQLLVEAGAGLPEVRRAAIAYQQPRRADGPHGRGTSGDHRWTATATGVLADARHHARRHGADQVDPGHVLAALLEPGHGMAPALLLAVGVDPGDIGLRLRSRHTVGEYPLVPTTPGTSIAVRESPGAGRYRAMIA